MRPSRRRSGLNCNFLCRLLASTLALAATGCGAMVARDAGERQRRPRVERFFDADARVILIAVRAQRGREPEARALALLAERLRERTGKAIGFAMGGDAASAPDPLEVERANPALVGLRVSYEARSPSGLRGLCEDRDLHMYMDQIRDEARLWITGATIERTVLVHEAGHAIGLNHCTRPDCVMYKPRPEDGVWDWRMVLANLAPALFLGRIPDDFCALCRRDLGDD